MSFSVPVLSIFPLSIAKDGKCGPVSNVAICRLFIPIIGASGTTSVTSGVSGKGVGSIVKLNDGIFGGLALVETLVLVSELLDVDVEASTTEICSFARDFIRVDERVGIGGGDGDDGGTIVWRLFTVDGERGVGRAFDGCKYDGGKQLRKTVRMLWWS